MLPVSIFGLKIWREAIALETKIIDGIFSVSKLFSVSKIRDEKNIPSLFRDGKVFGLYFRFQNLEGAYRATFRDGNLETEIFPCLNRDGNCFRL